MRRPIGSAALKLVVDNTREDSDENLARSACDELIGNVKKGPTKRKTATISDSVFSKLLSDVDYMISKSDWTDATPRHFVALYAKMHVRVYQIPDLSLKPKERYLAGCLAARMHANYFTGDTLKMCDYLRWAWKREMGREKWRRETHTEGSRLSWNLLFSGKLMSDYCLSQMRVEK